MENSFSPDPSIPLYRGSETLSSPVRLNITAPGVITSASLVGLQEGYTLNYSGSSCTLVLNSFGELFPFTCKFIDIVNMSTRTSHNSFEMFENEKIFEYRKSPDSPRYLYLDIFSSLGNARYEIIISANYSAQIPLLLNAVQQGETK